MLYVKNLFKKLGERFQRKSKEVIEDRHYSSIYNLPKWNWNQIIKYGNFNYLKVLHKYPKDEIDNSEYLSNSWDAIYQEYIDEFGFSEKFLKIIAKKKSIARHKNNYIQTGDRIILNFIGIEESELNSMVDDKNGLEFGDMIAIFEERYRRDIDVRDITVYKYENYIRTLGKNKGTDG